MSKMSIRIILKSGADFTIKCDEFTIERNQFGDIVKWKSTGIVENKPVHLDLSEVAAIVRVMSDETVEDDTENEGEDE